MTLRLRTVLPMSGADQSGRTPSRCPWAWRDPEDDDLYLCERKAGHRGTHAWTVEWNNFTDGAFEQGYVSAPARTLSLEAKAKNNNG